MNAVSLIQQQIQDARGFLEATMQQVTQEHSGWVPVGQALPIGAHYAHAVMSVDMTVGLLNGGAPLFASSWAGKTGTSGPPPLPPAPWDQWAREGQIDLTALRRYAQAVYAATDEYLSSLADEDVNRSVDLSAFGQGQRTVSWLLCTGCITNMNLHCGEISCLKGLQGAKGYPA